MRGQACAGFLVLAMLTEAMRDELHWVDKSVDAHPLAKRKAVCAQTGWSLCPASVGGGCCPEYFSCGTASCFATTAGPTSCNGRFNYYSCPLTAGPGSCCPVGLICGDGANCVAPPGASVSMTCPASWFNCPVSLGGGCCEDGKLCGSNICYENTPMTFPVSETKTTTDSSGHTTITVVTSTTVITDVPNLSTLASANGVPQLIPSTVAKVNAIQTDESQGGGGLSGGAVGGIVAGVVVILLIVIAVATFIVLRLRRIERATKAADYRHESPNGHAQSQKSAFGQPSISEIGSSTDVNPLGLFPIMQQSPRPTPANYSSSSRTPDYSNPSPSPPIWGVPINYAPSEASDGRQSSVGSYPYHDGNLPQRVSVDSYDPPGHSRRTSETSELNEQHGISELGRDDSDAGARRRSSSGARSAKSHVRKNSDLSGHNRGRSDTGATLGTVSEIYELHGHYGPAHSAVGQTAVELNRGSSNAGSESRPPDT